MGDKTGISWTDSTWNPVRGCSRISKGCMKCYAEGVAARFSGPGQAYEGFAERGRAGSAWTGMVALVPAQLDQPRRWARSRRIFVNSMSDLFHEDLPFPEIDQVFDVMEATPRHTYQILTKRSSRMANYTWSRWGHRGPDFVPPTHIHLGVSVEDQDAARQRIEPLKSALAAVRFLSVEPMIGPVDLSQHLDCWWNQKAHQWVREHDKPVIDWVICGGESGQGARPMYRAWAEALRDQCQGAGVAFFMKQVGSNRAAPRNPFEPRWPEMAARKGDDPAEWPEDLRLQEFPAVQRPA